MTAASTAELHSELAAERVTLVTPNRRLAVFHKNEFNRAQQSAGRLTWPSPDILPFPAFVERTWRMLNLRAPQSTVTQATQSTQLLDGPQARLLWERVIRESGGTHALMNVSQAARQAASAWTLARAWHLLPAMAKISLHEDAAMFLAWTHQYQRLCREQQAIDDAQLPDVLASLLATGTIEASLLPSRVLAVGFDIVTPQQQHLWRAFREARVDIATFEIVRTDEPRMHARLAFANESDELRACAAWARQRLEQSTLLRIAIVVPDLQARRNSIARELTDALLPGARADGADGAGAGENASALFNFSLGQALGDYALVRDALSLLTFSLSQSRAMPLAEVSALLRSPYIASADREQAVRAQLDARLRKVASTELSLRALRRQLSAVASLKRQADACGQLCERLDRVAALIEPSTHASGKHSAMSTPHDWSRHFAAVLNAWGFPGERALDSGEYQVVAKFRDALATLATLSSVQARMRGDEALSQLRRIVADTAFQPESAGPNEAPIQVLGILESASQTFDAMWIMGLNDDAWPLPARPNPFIPAGLQRSAGVAEASAEASLALDERITTGWLSSAAEVVVSHLYPEDATPNEQDRGASALISHVPRIAVAALLARGVPASYAAALQTQGRVEAIPEVRAEALAAVTAIRGGAAVFADQAACPFRAFARHRLGAAPLVVPQPVLDASERGSLLHRVMALVWEALRDHATLMKSNEADTAKLVADAVARAIGEAHSQGADILTGRFARIETERLCTLASEWLVVERERQPFVVEACEAKRDVSLGGLALQLRLDRLDRLADGTHALIDYKTGEADVAGWLGGRPDEPQLPLYFRTATEHVSALAFARLKRDKHGKLFGFAGFSAAEGLLPQVATIENQSARAKHRYASWDELTQQWEVSLDTLAAAFTRSDAAVDPKYGAETCKRCDLQSLCRIAEVTAYAEQDSAQGNDVADVANTERDDD